jgi:hypothetical protein
MAAQSTYQFLFAHQATGSDVFGVPPAVPRQDLVSRRIGEPKRIAQDATTFSHDGVAPFAGALM